MSDIRRGVDLKEIENHYKYFCKIGVDMDKLIKKDKRKIDKMMDTLVKKDIPRDKKLEKMKKGKC